MEKRNRPKVSDVGPNPTSFAKYCVVCKKKLKKAVVTEIDSGKVWCSLSCCLGVKIEGETK